MDSIARCVRQFKQQWTEQLCPRQIERACQEVGYRWRERRLPPVRTLGLFLLQVLHGNTACAALPHLSGLTFTAGAFCRARARLPLAVFARVLMGVLAGVRAAVADEGRWHGHRTFLVDGSGFSMADTPELQAAFGQPGGQRPGCGFPVARFLALFHAGTGMLLQVHTAPLRTHDLSQVATIHPLLEPGDLLLGDRGFCSYAHLALLSPRHVHAVFRVHQKQIVEFTPRRPFVPPGRRQRAVPRRGAKARTGRRPSLPSSRWVARLGHQDQLVEWFKPVECPVWLSAKQFAALPDQLLLRELRYRVPRRGFRTREVTLVTTLLDATRYPKESLAELYGQRWEVETHLARLKTTMQMDVLHTETVEGVLKELHVFGIVYNLVRLVMLEAAKRQGVAVGRISFTDALRWLRHTKPGQSLCRLLVNPLRPGRVEPRVRKRRPKEFPVMQQPRVLLRKQLMAKWLVA